MSMNGYGSRDSELGDQRGVLFLVASREEQLGKLDAMFRRSRG